MTISATLVISVIFSVLTPKGNMGKYFKIILAVFIFVSFVYPIKNGNYDFTVPEFDNIITEDETQNTYENIFENYISQLLYNADYSSSNVDVKLKYDGNEICINSLDVGISDEFDKDEIHKYILQNTGFNAKVYYLGE